MAIQQGWNSMTSAARHTIAKHIRGAIKGGIKTYRRRKRSEAKAARRTAKRARKSLGSGVKLKSRHLVAGSAAAKAWGRKMKRMRKK